MSFISSYTPPPSIHGNSRPPSSGRSLSAISHQIENFAGMERRLIDAATLQTEFEAAVPQHIRNGMMSGHNSVEGQMAMSWLQAKLSEMGFPPNEVQRVAQNIASGAGIEKDLQKISTRRANAYAKWSLWREDMKETLQGIKASNELAKTA